MDEFKLIEILTDEYKKDAEEKGWDDIRYLTDEEISKMNPPAKEHLIFLIAEKRTELKEVRDTLEYLRDKMNDPKVSSYFKTETRADIREEELVEMRLLMEIERAEKEYGEDNIRLS